MMLFSDLICFEQTSPGWSQLPFLWCADVFPSGEAEVKDAKKGIRAKLLGFYMFLWSKKSRLPAAWLKTKSMSFGRGNHPQAAPVWFGNWRSHSEVFSSLHRWNWRMTLQKPSHTSSQLPSGNFTLQQTAWPTFNRQIIYKSEMDRPESYVELSEVSSSMSMLSLRVLRWFYPPKL